jgi:hypothetical protein
LPRPGADAFVGRAPFEVQTWARIRSGASIIVSAPGYHVNSPLLAADAATARRRRAKNEVAALPALRVGLSKAATGPALPWACLPYVHVATNRRRGVCTGTLGGVILAAVLVPLTFLADVTTMVTARLALYDDVRNDPRRWKIFPNLAPRLRRFLLASTVVVIASSILLMLPSSFPFWLELTLELIVPIAGVFTFMDAARALQRAVSSDGRAHLKIA